MNPLVEGSMYVLSTVGALLPIVNPLSAVGLVMSITADLSAQERTDQIRRACIYMFWILTAFLVAGGLIMNFFGISIPGLRIAGGMIVSYLGFRMLFPDTAAISMQERAEASAKADISFTPLAMPSLSGPGSIAVVIGMSTTVQTGTHIVVGYALVAIGIAITALISYIVLRAATKLDKVLGAVGMNAMSRIMGFLLICIGIQFVINGIKGVVVEL
jgi:multiple antibiotic resistance protein